MPILGNGILPTGGIGQELTYITRRAFIPQLVVQIYKSTPMLSVLMKNAQRAKGGASQITVPVQGNSFVSFGWLDYSGTFAQPAEVSAIQNAEFNLKGCAVPIPFTGMESIIQSSEVVIPRLKARMADAKTVMVQSISSYLFSNNTANPQACDSLAMAYDDSTNVSTYGGIDRTASGNSFWKGQYFGSLGTTGSPLTRSGIAPYLVRVTAAAGGEAPDMVVTSPGDWSTLLQDFMADESFQLSVKSQYGIDDVVNSGFRGLMIGNTPFFMDPYCPKGTMYMINTKYLAMYISEDAAFEFTGFHSMIPNMQLADVGVLLLLFNVVCTKPVSGAQLTGITGQVF